MTKEEYLKIAEDQWETLKNLEEEATFYDYEKKFDKMMVDFGRSLMNEQMKGKGTDRRKKKSQNPLRRNKSK